MVIVTIAAAEHASIENLKEAVGVAAQSAIVN